MRQVTIYLEDELEAKMVATAKARKRRERSTAVQALPFDSAEAEARIQISLEKQGTPIGPYDLLIAGTALAQNATLVTRNTRKFNRIKKLQVENWY
ncbi:PIN domain-containing protein, partial [Nitrincola sp. A-D6]|uniref:PIN domain-containing protein n=1 Tax=Nitrincola sp. A-D6 TaxID=1545442 RepID=UPI00056D6238